MKPTPGRVFNPYRKLWHMLGLVIPLFLYLDLLSSIGEHASRFWGIVILFCLIVLVFALDLARFFLPPFRRFWYNTVGFLMKAEEAHRFNATIPYLVASLLLFLFVGKELSLIACLYLMIGDPMAAFVGGRTGRFRFANGKSLEGLLAFILAGALAAILFLLLHGLFFPQSVYALFQNPGPLLLAALCGSVFAAVAEFFSWTALRGLYDDNLSVPLAGALGFCLAGHYAGLPWSTLLFAVDRLFV
ncbi:MAG: dolichol kinase [Spirochaetales bacterium]|nr:dolichol kinase [Spirochaetales bacterium]